ncbi:Hpt domain-containing protein [Pseudoflavonifractor sp. MCC625]|nr:Hpt domain-containing protein [Pseudoflavonifractor sp. MCC625]
MEDMETGRPRQSVGGTEMDLNTIAQTLGLDLTGTLARFGGSEALLVRFLKKFPQDGSFAALCAAVEQGDMQGVEHAAHTLKGVAANLGLERLKEHSDALVAAVRKGETEGVPALFAQVREDHAAILSALEKL